MHKLYSREQGFVSILTVIFFVLLMSVLTIGFLRIVTDEQEQVIDDDLSKGALASAQSGVEDAKRAMLYCRQQANPAIKAQCFSAIQNQTCPGTPASRPGGMFSGSVGPQTLVSALGLDASAGDGSIKVGDPTNDNNQRYTCVTMNLNTNDVIGQMSSDLGDLIPLRATGPFNGIKLSWHQTNIDGQAVLPTQAAVPFTRNPREPAWINPAGVSYVAEARLQLLAFDRSQTLTAQKDNSAGMFLVPYNGAGTSPRGPELTVGTVNPNWSADKRVEVRCALDAGYMCSTTLTIPTAPPNVEYYLLVKSQYGKPHYKLQLLNGNNVVTFSDVQPIVDSTGATANVYRRILSRVNYESDNFFTSNAVESGISICKDFFVTRTTATYDSNCIEIP